MRARAVRRAAPSSSAGALPGGAHPDGGAVPRDHRAPSSFIQFAPDGTRVVSASHDGSGVVWDITSRRRLHVLEHAGAVTYAEFNHDGTMLVTASEDHTAALWD